MPASSTIILDDDDEDIQYLTERSSTRSRNRSVSSTRTIGRSIEPEEVDEVFGEEIIDLTDESHDFSRHSLLDDGEISIPRLPMPTCSVEPGMFLEIREMDLGKYRINFILVRVIVKLPGTGQLRLRGIPVARTRNLLGKLPRKLNEVCMIVHYDDPNDAIGSQGLIDIKPCNVITPRTLILTNDIWTKRSVDITGFQHIQDKSERQRAIERSGKLTCRWKLETYFRAQGNHAKPIEEAIIRIRPDEVKDPKHLVSEDAILDKWRGGRVKGGSYVPKQPSSQLGYVNVDDAQPDSSSRTFRLHGQQYTMFDSFSGAGGASRGAHMAGFKVQYAVDHEPNV